MNLRKLECFLVLANELHFGNAADKLFMAQPPLSRSIRELEEELQVKLFKRNSRKVELTRGGLLLQEEAKKLFAHIDHIKDKLKQTAAGVSGKLKVGYVGAAMHSVLPGILVALKKELDINIILTELKNEEQVDALAGGQIDIGFVRSVPEKKDIAATRIFTETFSLILPLNHPFAINNRTDLLELANEPFIGLNYDCAPKLSDAIMDICKNTGFAPKVAHETSQINSIVRLVESGMGYSIVPTSVKNAYSINVKFVELKQYKERAQLFLMHKKEMDALTKQCVSLITAFALPGTIIKEKAMQLN